MNQLTAFSWGNLSDANSEGIPDTITSPSRSQSWTPDGQGNFTTVTTNGTVCFFRRSGVPPLGLIWPGLGHWPNRTVFPGSREVTREPFAKAKRRDAASTEDRIATISSPSRSQSWTPDGQGNFTTVTTNGTGEARTYDKQNQVTALIDTSGNVVERYVYDPYGKVTILSPDGSTVKTSSNYGWSYLHQGGRQDTATGLLNFRNRDYSTSLMRWTTNDPIGFAGGDTNTYRYVGNGPGNGLDPSGLAKNQGHNIVTNPIRKIVSDEAREVFNSLDGRITNDYFKSHGSQRMNGITHYDYNKAVKKEFDKFFKNKDPKKEAEKFLKHLKNLPDSNTIKQFNNGVQAAADAALEAGKKNG